MKIIIALVSLSSNALGYSIQSSKLTRGQCGNIYDDNVQIADKCDTNPLASRCRCIWIQKCSSGDYDNQWTTMANEELDNCQTDPFAVVSQFTEDSIEPCDNPCRVN